MFPSFSTCFQHKKHCFSAMLLSRMLSHTGKHDKTLTGINVFATMSYSLLHQGLSHTIVTVMANWKCFIFLGSSQSESILKLKRRFLKDKKGIDVYFAKREIARQKLRTVQFKNIFDETSVDVKAHKDSDIINTVVTNCFKLKFLVRLQWEYNTSLALQKHHVNLFLQSFRSVSTDFHQC